MNQPISRIQCYLWSLRKPLSQIARGAHKVILPSNSHVGNSTNFFLNNCIGSGSNVKRATTGENPFLPKNLREPSAILENPSNARNQPTE
ncbi:hypothetical protein TNIN_497791 [Trichonephila inaurata madagascariensis]|uniref:Uncharacterized protein n=1 Tax=Trichonephila inaurata madagascariensis TaxID=2747483 RepID=A0A8X6XDY3_9ARAC|nr:hypothetical protein TNIN_497791 [Trichonephila inaurata madagascariensis]